MNLIQITMNNVAGLEATLASLRFTNYLCVPKYTQVQFIVDICVSKYCVAALTVSGVIGSGLGLVPAPAPVWSQASVDHWHRIAPVVPHQCDPF